MSHFSDTSQKIVLVIGSCGLDRLLTVPKFPTADSKIRTTSYNEMGGGNASNTAAAIGLLCTASFLSHANLSVKLLTKVGDDTMGRQLTDELDSSGVDVSSPLFRVGHRGSTTSFTSIIVSEQENTRTCLHTPGTCGELTATDVEEANMDELFWNVVHVHSDTRHTEASLVVVQEARKRGISVSVDAEKDRDSHSFDHLLEAATMIFINSTQLQDYLARRNKEMEAHYERHPLPDPIILPGSNILLTDPLLNIYAKAVEPSFYFQRFSLTECETKEVISTGGDMGALHVTCSSRTTETDMEDGDNDPYQEIVIDKNDDGSIRANQIANERAWAAIYQESKLSYEILSAGVIPNAHVVDTTGAGDAFIAGYLVSLLGTDERSRKVCQQCLQFGSWVGGCKLNGAGARAALPRGIDVDSRLGRTFDEVGEALRDVIGQYGESRQQLESPT